MSLTVSLTVAVEVKDTVPIRVYEADFTERALTRHEWTVAFPDLFIMGDFPSYEEVYEANITGNLGRMAAEAGIYDALWRPDEIGLKTADQLIEPLRQGIERLKANPAHFKHFDASNGWGTYEQFIPWLLKYLNACEQYPYAEVSVHK